MDVLPRLNLIQGQGVCWMATHAQDIYRESIIYMYTCLIVCQQSSNLITKQIPKLTYKRGVQQAIPIRLISEHKHCLVKMPSKNLDQFFNQLRVTAWKREDLESIEWDYTRGRHMNNTIRELLTKYKV